MKNLRLEAQVRNEVVEQIARARMDALLKVCRGAHDELKRWHSNIAEKTDLDLTGFSRASAIWLLSGRALGLLEAIFVQVEAGIDTEVLVTGRALHEADLMLMAFTSNEGEDLVRLWLEDEGRHRYVRTKKAREAQDDFEEEVDKARKEQGLPSFQRTQPLIEMLYDRLSRTAHSRRSSCVAGVWKEGRQYAYGCHADPLRRAAAVEWAASMTGEVLNAVGDGLRAFYGGEFFSKEIVPIFQAIEAVRQASPLDHESLLAAVKDRYPG